MPFGAVVRTDGELRLISGTGDDWFQMLEMLYDGIAALEGAGALSSRKRA